MVRWLVMVLAVFAILTSSHGQEYNYIGRLPDSCQSCNPEECPKSEGCPAGIVKDACECCDVCGKAEFELCDHPQVKPPSGVRYGKCGDDLECRVRSDLEQVEGPEAICYCRIEGTVCGTDNVTYNSECQLRAARIMKKTRIEVGRMGPCNSAPMIITPPDSLKNRTGSNVAILCEAKGFPIPTIEWTWTRVDGQTVYLPSDDLHVSVNMRGGPEKWQVTGWLQIIDLQKHHEGDYTCVAQNVFGMAQANARINVITYDDDRRVPNDL